jgi:hypothetical protein
VIAADQKLKDIKSFIEGLALNAPELDQPSPELKRTYRLFHGLLIEDMVVETSNFRDATKDYFRETVSDSSSAFFLTLIGSYKPSRLVLRGACENVLRFLVGSKGKDASTLNTVAGLFAEARALCAGKGLLLGYIGKLDVVYDELCKTSHSTHVDYMSLAVPFSALFSHKDEPFKANIELIGRTFEQILFLAYAELVDRLNTIDQGNADELRGLAPRALKVALTQ